MSYCFDDRNRWVEELVIPMISAFGFQVVSGRRMEGEILAEGIEARLRGCTGCLAFTTRRSPQIDGSFATHPWVVNELTQARALGFETIEIREDGVKIGDAAEAYVRLSYTDGRRDRLLVELAERLAIWKKKQRVRLRLDPPADNQNDFMRLAARRSLTCSYELQRNGETIANGETEILRVAGGCFVEIEIPGNDVLVQISLKKMPDNNVAWASFPEGLVAIPIKLL